MSWTNSQTVNSRKSMPAAGGLLWLWDLCLCKERFHNFQEDEHIQWLLNDARLDTFICNNHSWPHAYLWTVQREWFASSCLLPQCILRLQRVMLAMCFPLICKCFSTGLVLGSPRIYRGERMPSAAGFHPTSSRIHCLEIGSRWRSMASLSPAQTFRVFCPLLSISVIFVGTCFLICFFGSHANKWDTAEELSEKQ